MLEFSILFCSILMGFAGAPWWSVLIAGALMNVGVVWGDAQLAQRYAGIGVAKVFVVALTLSATNNLLFASLSYGLGRSTAWMVGM
jgi:hypothetical protein